MTRPASRKNLTIGTYCRAKLGGGTGEDVHLSCCDVDVRMTGLRPVAHIQVFVRQTTEGPTWRQ